MTDRNKRLLLLLASCMCVATGAGIGSATWLLPMQATPTSSMPRPLTAIQSSSEKKKERVFDENDFKFVWAKPLQYPLVDPKPAAQEKPAETRQAAKPKQPRIQLSAKLVGTLIDGDYARAWIEIGGKQQMVMPGDILKGHAGSPAVTDIEDRQVIVELAGEKHTLVMANPLFAELTVPQ